MPVVTALVISPALSVWPLGAAQAADYLTGAAPNRVNPTSVAVGDFNGDGFDDLAVTNYGTGNVAVLLGNGDGTFQAPALYPVGNFP